MASHYIPPADAQFLIFAQKFRDNIAADPSRYMLVAADVTAITGVVNTFEQKYAVASNENTRTKPTIDEKKAARYTCEQLLRQYAIDIKNNEGIDDADKLAIGVRPINRHREPIQAPQTFPLLNIVYISHDGMVLRYSDATTPNSRARPYGTIGLLLFRGIGESKSLKQAQCEFLGMYTRNPIRVTFDQADGGKAATFYARWVTAKGQKGPWSLPVSMYIAA